MKNDLLVSLRKYHPREGKDPLENFITEAFAWILKNFDEFSIFFIQKFFENIDFDINNQNMNWSTQANFGGVYPDMLLEMEGIALVFENKAWSDLHAGQLDSYRNYAKENYKKSYLVLITASSNQHSQNPDYAFCWSDICLWIKEWISLQEKESEFIFNDFSRLIENEGMGPPAPISHEAILCYYSARNLKEQISNLIRRIEHEDWGKLVPSSDFKLFIENKRGHHYGDAWGRIGVHLLGGGDNDWCPGVFVGFLIDGEEHCTRPLLEKKSPDFSVIIDFDINLHNQYPQHVIYKKFVGRVSDEIVKLNNGWDFYHHIEDQSIESVNKWHPIHIRKPMLELFRGTIIIEEQIQIFMKNTKEILNVIFCENKIQQLRDEGWTLCRDRTRHH